MSTMNEYSDGNDYTKYLNHLEQSNTQENHESMYQMLQDMSIGEQDDFTEFEDDSASFHPLKTLGEYEDDFMYMKSLYPLIVRKIQVEVNNECDQLEYSGSCMFDEHPDKVHLSTIINRIYNKVQEMDKDNADLQAEELSYNPLTAMSYRRCCGFSSPPPPPLSDYNQYGRPNWLHCLIEVMVINEMLFRRRRYCCRKYF